MRSNFITALSTIALMCLVSVGTAYAEYKNLVPQGHEEHHPNANGAGAANDTKTMSDQGNMMDKMDTAKMQGMMHECMEMHKDGKVCDHNMMAKCEEKMGKGECKKMMKHAKAHEKKSKNN